MYQLVSSSIIGFMQIMQFDGINYEFWPIITKEHILTKKVLTFITISLEWGHGN